MQISPNISHCLTTFLEAIFGLSSLYFNNDFLDILCTHTLCCVNIMITSMKIQVFLLSGKRKVGGSQLRNSENGSITKWKQDSSHIQTGEVMVSKTTCQKFSPIFWDEKMVFHLHSSSVHVLQQGRVGLCLISMALLFHLSLRSFIISHCSLTTTSRMEMLRN